MKEASLMNGICIYEKFNVWRNIDLLPEPLRKDIQ